jgi:hypothetical protein
MKRTTKLLGIGLLLTAVLAVAIGGTALAAPRSDNGDRIQLKDGSCGNCTSTTCEPVNHDYNYDHNYLTPGPHGTQQGNSD